LLIAAIFAAAGAAAIMALRDPETSRAMPAAARPAEPLAVAASEENPALQTQRKTAASSAPQTSARFAELRDRLQQSSLRGTTRDGDITVDANGRLVLDANLRRLFDYYLALTGEFSDSDLRTLLLGDVAEAHGAGAAAEVAEVFDRYLGLRAELAHAPVSADLAERFEQVRAARRNWFGDDADALFGDEEAQIAYTLERQALEASDELDDAERQARLDELEARRPATERAAQRDASAALLAAEQTRQLDALGADPTARHAERAELWGEQAADRLARLDRERADWDRRLAGYARSRAALIADSMLDASTRAAALDRLRRASFAPTEQLRIEALEAVGALPSGG
jgi:lipase chaperone LimK